MLLLPISQLLMLRQQRFLTLDLGLSKQSTRVATTSENIHASLIETFEHFKKEHHPYKGRLPKKNGKMCEF